MRTAIPEGALLRTGDTDLVEVEFKDGSRVHLDFDSKIQVEGASGKMEGERVDLDLLGGRAWLLVTPAHTGLRVRTRGGGGGSAGNRLSDVRRYL